MTSSGIYVDSYESIRYCGADECYFEGAVEIWIDPEAKTEWWDCPLCGYEHVSGLEGEDHDE